MTMVDSSQGLPRATWIDSFFTLTMMNSMMALIYRAIGYLHLLNDKDCHFSGICSDDGGGDSLVHVARHMQQKWLLCCTLNGMTIALRGALAKCKANSVGGVLFCGCPSGAADVCGVSE